MQVFLEFISSTIPVFAYLFQIAVTLVIAFGFSFIPYLGLRKIMNYPYTFSLIFSIILIFSTVYYLTFNPIIVCNNDFKFALTQEVKEEVLETGNGLYSNKLPLFPIYINIRSIQNSSIKYETKYWYFGSTQTEISRFDGVVTVQTNLFN